jgi:uncharacterized DUF497 family protein
MEFEWDEHKRAANLAKHGLDLVDGQALFDGRPHYTYSSPRSGEQRRVSIALLSDVLRWCGRNEALLLV